MVHDGADVPEGPVNLDAVRVAFDEERLISDAGLLVTATLAQRLGIEQLVNESVWLDPQLPGACLPGRKVMSLVHGMLVGADSIDDMNVVRAGSTGMILGHRVMAPSTLGTFCGRSRSGTCDSLTGSWTRRSRGRGQRAPVRVRGSRW